ncbi:hypothetical protein GOV07_02925 [Candidatus Woesearchaeota archaeon]|nr:hypothetical protein [Candidatus Woesearchaeota archaeon]
MKRGQAELYYSFIRIILIILLVFLLNIQLGFFTNVDVPTEHIEAEIAQQRLLARLAPVDGTTGFVALSQFNSKDVTDSYLESYGDENLWGGRLRLYETHDALIAETPNYNATLAENGAAVKLLPLSKAGVRGRGGANYHSWLHPVIIVYDDETRALGWLTIELVKRT